MQGILILAVAAMALISQGMAGVGAEGAATGNGYREQAAAAQEPQRPIDVNSASSKELESIPGIGPAMAQRIITWREQNGPFERVEDLLNVRGIGVKTLEKLRPYVVVVPESTTRSW